MKGWIDGTESRQPEQGPCNPLSSVFSPAWVSQAGLWLLSVLGISARPAQDTACLTPTVNKHIRTADCAWWSLGESPGGLSATEVTMGGGFMNPRCPWAPMAAGCLFLGLCFHPFRDGKSTTSQALVLLSDQGACPTFSQNPPPGCQQRLTLPLRPSPAVGVPVTSQSSNPTRLKGANTRP